MLSRLQRAAKRAWWRTGSWSSGDISSCRSVDKNSGWDRMISLFSARICMAQAGEERVAPVRRLVIASPVYLVRHLPVKANFSRASSACSWTIGRLESCSIRMSALMQGSWKISRLI